MNLLLKLKHWQLFLLLFVIPVALQIILVFFTIDQGDPSMMFSVFPWLIAFYLLLLLGWFWAMGHLLYSRLPDTVQMNLTLFRVFLIFPAVYILAFLFYVFNFLVQFQDPEALAMAGLPNPLIFVVILPLHVFSMFCLFYCMYFISKSLKAVELQQDVTLSDYMGEFALIWIWPVGLWFIQPRINKIFNENEAGNGNA